MNWLVNVELHIHWAHSPFPLQENKSKQKNKNRNINCELEKADERTSWKYLLYVKKILQNQFKKGKRQLERFETLCRVLVYKVGKNGHAFNKLFCYSSMFLRSFIFKKCVAELIIYCFTLLERSWGVFWWYSRLHLLLHMVPYWDDVMIPGCGPNMKNIIYLMILRPVTENYRWLFCVKWFFKRTPLLKNLPYKMISTNKN